MPVIYHVAGPADDEDYAQAEYLAETLMSSLKGVECILHPVMPDEWTAFVSEKAAFLGCKQRAPLVWMSTGVVVGGLPEWAAECDKKYGISAKHISFETWTRIAAENASASKTAPKAAPIGASSGGLERAVAVSAVLLEGNSRYIEGASSGSPSGSERLAAGVVATVLALTPLPAAPHILLDCPASSLFVVPCTPTGVELLAVGNIEHGIMSLGTTALIVLAAPTEELPLYVQAARDAVQAKDAPLPTAQLAVLGHMMPALARTFAVAPPQLKPAELERLCLEEWARESADEMLRQSAVLQTMKARGGIHVERWVCDADGAISVV